MNKFFQLAVLALLTVLFFATAAAQKQKSKEDYFKEFSNLSNSKKAEDLERAFQISKEFLARFSNEKSENANKIRSFFKQFRENKFFTLINQNNTVEAFSLGKEILAESPDNSLITLNLANAGFKAFVAHNDQSFADQSIKFAKQTISFFESGKILSNYSPFANKDEANAWMYYIIGVFLKDSDLKESAHNLFLATQFESKIKSNSYPYFVIANYYEKIYENLAANYNSKVKSMTETEAKAELEKINKVLDQMLDSYARTVKFAEAENVPQKDDWRKRLTELYKFRKKLTSGLDEFINYINTTAMTDPISF